MVRSMIRPIKLRRSYYDLEEKPVKVHRCPDCGYKGPHEDNGFPPEDVDYSLLCRCGCNWDPNI